MSSALDGLNQASRKVRMATARALNKVTASGRTQASRQIRAIGYQMKSGDIKKAIVISQRANQADLNTNLRGSGKPLPLIQFAARQTKVGVSVNVKSGRKVVPHTFIAVMPSGHRGVFVRIGTTHRRRIKDGRRISTGLPIKELFGPSIKAAFANPDVQSSVKDTISERFPIVLRQELAYEALK